jgi:N-acetylglutamate synthase-like GNAT family acetyltransferase
MLDIIYKEVTPSFGDYKNLYTSTGWKYRYPVTEDNLRTALKNTWLWISAYHEDDLVGAGRLISDGALYAFVCDLIVLPEYKNMGIGSSILNRMKKNCIDKQIKRVWLFAAQNKAEFYEKLGFEVRPSNMPGMQLSDNC